MHFVVEHVQTQSCIYPKYTCMFVLNMIFSNAAALSVDNQYFEQIKKIVLFVLTNFGPV